MLLLLYIYLSNNIADEAPAWRVYMPVLLGRKGMLVSYHV